MLKRCAVIDLGTNTFHLLIADIADKGSFLPVYQERQFVKLGQEGINHLGRAPYERGIKTIIEFHRLIQQYQVDQVQAVGTAALRTADNGQVFIREVQQLTGVAIELISGEQEAEWIYKGVKQAVPLTRTPALIMDIGGGSVEFILADERDLIWRHSFPVGLSILHQHFHRNDPISYRECEAIHDFLEEQLTPLWRQLSLFPVKTLIGAAGAFEIFPDFLPHQLISPHYQHFKTEDFPSLYRTIITSTVDQRLTMEKLPPARVDLIVVAMELIHFILQKSGVEKIAVTDFAIKEGILIEMY